MLGDTSGSETTERSKDSLPAQTSWLTAPFLPDLLSDFALFAGRSSGWMDGRTPPWEMTTWPSSLLSSSSFRTASCRCRGMIRDFLLSRAAFPASSRISADCRGRQRAGMVEVSHGARQVGGGARTRYSSTAAR